MTESFCPTTAALSIIQGKWTTQVLFALLKNDHLRFGELKRAVGGITNAMLVNTLKDLEKNGIVIRTQYNEMPLRVEYSLTAAGKQMDPIFRAIKAWGQANLSPANN